MPALSRLIKIWALGKAFSFSVPPINKILCGLAAIAISVIIASVLIGSAIVGALYFAYTSMLLHGVDRDIAMAIIAGVTLLFILLFLGWAWICWRRIRKLTGRFMVDRPPIAKRVSTIANAFVSGLMGD